ncbi:MAG TPA: TIGR00725 family protein [Actinomycetota bacterium]|nr:TIGR00725 family protein [Actinomycetota bacterium]
MGPYVAVIGASRPSGAVAEAGQRVGELVAQAGAVLVCGGRGGVMEAACRGARACGGLTVGILPGLTRAEANPYVDVALPTGLGDARNALVVSSADVVIAVGGGPGTLSEIGLALSMGRAVVGLLTWEATAPSGGSLDIARAASPEEAVAMALGRLPR